MNFLNSVFWDYPEFTNEKNLKKLIQKNKQTPLYLWIMNRFLEYGRVIDVFNFFTIQEINQNIDKLKPTDYTLKKWKRILEIYGKY